ncbi:MAG: cell division protein DivIC [Bacteroidia bacterium]|jgi:cell division protein DivIC
MAICTFVFVKKPIYKNKYLLIFVAALVWVVFFDSNNLIYQYRLGQEIRDLSNEKDFYLEEIEKLKHQRESLNSDVNSLEKYAREEFLMKKENETLYLLDERN